MKEGAQETLGSPHHKSKSVQIKYEGLVNIGLTKEFKPQLGSAGNEQANDDSDSNDSEASMSTIKSLHDCD